MNPAIVTQISYHSSSKSKSENRLPGCSSSHALTMPGSQFWSRNSAPELQPHFPFSFDSSSFTCGGIFLEPIVSSSFMRHVSSRGCSVSDSTSVSSRKPSVLRGRGRNGVNLVFLSMSLTSDGTERERRACVWHRTELLVAPWWKKVIPLRRRERSGGFGCKDAAVL